MWEEGLTAGNQASSVCRSVCNTYKPKAHLAHHGSGKKPTRATEKGILLLLPFLTQWEGFRGEHGLTKIKDMWIKTGIWSFQTHYYNSALVLHFLPYPRLGISSSLTKSERRKWCFAMRNRLITDSLTWEDIKQDLNLESLNTFCWKAGYRNRKNNNPF